MEWVFPKLVRPNKQNVSENGTKISGVLHVLKGKTGVSLKVFRNF